MTPEAERFIELAKTNRRKFLEPYKRALEPTEENIKRAVAPHWKSIRNLEASARKRRMQELFFQYKGEIIIYLLKLEPSHLQEPWISEVVVKWMREVKYVECLKMAFIEQNGRDRPTPNEYIQDVKDFFLRDKIRRIRKEKSIGKDQAFKILAESQIEDPNSLYPGVNAQDGGYKKIQKRYYDSQKNRKSIDELPYPYWGYDVREHQGNVVLFMVGAMSIGDGPRQPGTVTLDINNIDEFPAERPRR